jgi:Zn-dependent peptidase ImmA (M78 family)
MPSLQREEAPASAEQRAREVLARYGPAAPPVALAEICRCEGLAVCARPFDYVAGIFVNDGVFPVIVVNSRDRRTRQRFTLAHELGHYFLRHRRKSFAEPGGKSPLEREANRFAASLLMPAAWVRRSWKDYASNSENRLPLLAELFEVSQAAMEVRVKELGLNGPPRPRR